MPDIINLLPDTLANQIAAGEVIQRPASAVKEMLENAIDAGATNIHLILKNAGKELIQVIDNGKGMSDTDARMCFERHATSKIKSIDDLKTKINENINIFHMSSFKITCLWTRTKRNVDWYWSLLKIIKIFNVGLQLMFLSLRKIINLIIG